MFRYGVDRKSLLKDIIFVCSKLDDGISKLDIYEYFKSRLGNYDISFIDLSIEVGLEFGWILKSDENGYTLTPAGRKIISSKLVTDKKEINSKNFQFS